MVLTERRDHLKLFAELLQPHTPNLIVLQGGMGKKQRRHIQERLADVTDGEPRVILSTGRYLGEGLDDARLDTLFLTLPISRKGALAQYAGRLHREYHQKKEVVALMHQIPVTRGISLRFLELMETNALSHKPGIADILIAATALDHGLSLFTPNVKDSRYIPELEVYEETATSRSES